MENKLRSVSPAAAKALRSRSKKELSIDRGIVRDILYLGATLAMAATAIASWRTSTKALELSRTDTSVRQRQVLEIERLTRENNRLDLSNEQRESLIVELSSARDDLNGKINELESRLSEERAKVAEGTRLLNAVGLELSAYQDSASTEGMATLYKEFLDALRSGLSEPSLAGESMGTIVSLLEDRRPIRLRRQLSEYYPQPTPFILNAATTSALDWLETLPDSAKSDARELVDGFVENCDKNFTVKQFSFSRPFPQIDDFPSSLSIIGTMPDGFRTQAEVDNWSKRLKEARENESQVTDIANAYMNDFNFEKRRYMSGVYAEIAACIPTPPKLRAHPALKGKDSFAEIKNSGLRSDYQAWDQENMAMFREFKGALPQRD